MIEKEIRLWCVGCGRQCGESLVHAPDETAMRRIEAFMQAFRCGPCWVAWMQVRDARRAAARARTMGVPQEPQRRSIYSEAEQPMRQAPMLDRWGRPVAA